MAVNEAHIDAAPSAVFDVLADPRTWSDWVVGASEIRRVEGRWPRRGATFHHTQGVGPLSLKDTASVVQSRRPSRLVVEVRGRPFIVGRVELRLRSMDGGTQVQMVERPIGGWISKLYNPLLDLLLQVRNGESLRRLKRLAEGR